MPSAEFLFTLCILHPILHSTAFAGDHLIIFVDGLYPTLRDDRGDHFHTLQLVIDTAADHYPHKPIWIARVTLFTPLARHGALNITVYGIHNGRKWSWSNVHVKRPPALDYRMLEALYFSVRSMVTDGATNASSKEFPSDFPDMGEIRGAVAFMFSNTLGRGESPTLSRFLIGSVVGYKADTKEDLVGAVEAVAIGRGATVFAAAFIGACAFAMVVAHGFLLLYYKYYTRAVAKDFAMVVQARYPKIKAVRKFMQVSNRLDPDQWTPSEYQDEMPPPKSESERSGREKPGVKE